MKREERITTLAKLEKSPLFEGMDLKQEYPVEMAHDVMVKKLPKGYEIIASANETPIAGMQHKELGIYGIQFHPERNWLAPIVFKNFYNLG
jgi:GMP synthase (glutamine-hydrolysing)